MQDLFLNIFTCTLQRGIKGHPIHALTDERDICFEKQKRKWRERENAADLNSSAF